MVRICAFLLLVFALPLVSYGQYNDNGMTSNDVSSKDVFYKYSVQAGTEITYAVTDGAMVHDFSNGIYAANLAFDAAITKRVYMGVEGFSDEFGEALPLYGILNPRMYLTMGGIRVGYRSSLTNTFLFNATFTGGEAFVTYSGSLINPPRQQSQFGALKIMESYRLDEQFWIGLDISFTYLPYTYSPYTIGLNNYYEYPPSSYQGPTTFIGWGFQLFYLFSKK